MSNPVSFTVTVSAKNSRDLSAVKRLLQRQFPKVSIAIHPKNETFIADPDPEVIHINPERE